MAKAGRFRVPESIFLCLAIIGASLGILLAMKIYHHKTTKIKFALGVPVVLLFQVSLFFDYFVLHGAALKFFIDFFT